MFDLLVIVPYRDRRAHLEVFAPRLEAHLRGKQTFKLLVVEQTPGSPFNRGKLINCGFRERCCETNHMVMHDVDMVPETDVDYSPWPWPLHLAGRATQYGGKLPYDNYVGGVLMITTWHFEQINGFGNNYWGWGREDDELWLRLEAMRLSCDRREGRFHSLSHSRPSQPLPVCEKQFQKARAGHIDFQADGLHQTRYEVKQWQPLAEYLDRSLGPQHEVVLVDLLYGT